jgi:hypothetical protein
MKVIIIVLIADAVISTILGIANVIIKKNIDKTLSDCAHELRKSIREKDDI